MLSDLECRLCFTVQMEDSSLLVPLSEVDLIFSKFCSLVNSVASHGETEMINDDIYFALTILMHSNLLNSWFYCCKGYVLMNIFISVEMSAYILFKVSTLQLNKQAIAGYFHYILPRFTYPDLSGLLND